jgi:hypothetical protein
MEKNDLILWKLSSIRMKNIEWNCMQLELNHNRVQIQMKKKKDVNWCKIIRHFASFVIKLLKKKKLWKEGFNKKVMKIFIHLHECYELTS